MKEDVMTHGLPATMVACIVGIAVAVVVMPPAAQSQSVESLKDNDGIFVDKGTFKIVRSNGAKSDPEKVLAQLGAKEVAAGAVIYRHGDKLYIVDGTPPANASPQFMVTLHDWCPTCHWYTPGSYMK
jgi:hypothetical protein